MSRKSILVVDEKSQREIMKIFQPLIGSLTVIVLFAISIAAQTEKSSTIQSNKIAKVNTKTFEDDKLGIKDLLIAYDEVTTELKPQIDELQGLSTKLREIHENLLQDKKILETDIRPGCSDPNFSKKFDAKFEEYNKLFREFEGKVNIYKPLWEKFFLEKVSPVKNKISKALEQFKLEKDYALIVDITALGNESSIIETDNITDVTEDFINFYNASFSRVKSQ